MIKTLPVWLRWILGIVLCLAFLALCAYGLIRWHGSNAWSDALAEYEAAGFSLSYEDLIPDPIPDEENFGALDFLKGITIPEGNAHPSGIDGAAVRTSLTGNFESYGFPEMYDAQDVTRLLNLKNWALYLEGLSFEQSFTSPVEPERDPAKNAAHARTILRELDSHFGSFFASADASLSRKATQFLPDSSEFIDPVVPYESKTTPPLISLINYTRILQTRAIAAALLKDSDTARASILSILRLAADRSFNPWGWGIGQHAVETTLANMAVNTLQHALEFGVFDAPTLAELQDEFAKHDFRGAFVRALQIEAITLTTSVAAFHDGRDILRQDAETEILSPFSIEHVRAYFLRTILNNLLIPALSDDVHALKAGRDQVLKACVSLRFQDPFLMSETWTCMSAYQFDAAFSSAATACALERYFLTHGTYPDTLKSLVPEFIESVPEDPIDKSPLRYRPSSDGYVLYSIGWDLADNAGKPADLNRIRKSESDWVWTHKTLR